MKLESVNIQDIINQHLDILRGLQYDSGLFAASSKNVSTGYDKSWLRDNFYEALAFLIIEDYDTVQKTAKALLRIFEKHEYKIDHAIANRPQHRHEYIHARFHPESFDEFWEEWGNKQNDAIGAILFLLGELYHRKQNVLETKKDYELVQKLVDYLTSLHYWEDQDSGMWEENEEIHASSVGACLAGLNAVKKIPGIKVPVNTIRNGRLALNKLLPRESEKKFVDLALLSLIFPYNVTSPTQTEEILKNTEYHLVKKRGVIRYKTDYYYNKNPDGMSEEAEWTFGFSWLALIYAKLGNDVKAQYYERKTIETINDEGEVPELYYSNSDEYNENSPLGWSESMLIIALYALNKKHINVDTVLEGSKIQSEE